VTNIEITNPIKTKVGDQVSLEITTFVFGIIEAINADGSADIRLDDTVRAVKQDGARFPDPFWIECEDAE
jgi:hypothetical protein